VREQYLKVMGIPVYRLRDHGEEKGSVPFSEIVKPSAKSSTLDTAAEKGTDPFSDDLQFYMEMDSGPEPDAGEADIYIPCQQSGPDISTLSWQALQQRVSACQRCELGQSRKNAVFGVGNPDADIMVIGEAPGADEDAIGEPFVGAAGKLLDNMLKAIGLDRDKIFITNILKCRPPSNRNPTLEEVTSCEAYLMQQIALIQPKLILSVGGVSAKSLLKTEEAVGRLRLQKQQLVKQQIPVQVTYHPAYLLRKPSEKAKSWIDLKKFKQAMLEMGIE